MTRCGPRCGNQHCGGNRTMYKAARVRTTVRRDKDIMPICKSGPPRRNKRAGNADGLTHARMSGVSRREFPRQPNHAQAIPTEQAAWKRQNQNHCRGLSASCLFELCQRARSTEVSFSRQSKCSVIFGKKPVVRLRKPTSLCGRHSHQSPTTGAAILPATPSLLPLLPKLLLLRRW